MRIAFPVPRHTLDMQRVEKVSASPTMIQDKLVHREEKVMRSV